MLRFRKSHASGSPSIPMSPLIDITFLLLIFFMLNLKIIAPEGNFDVTLPQPTAPIAVEAPPAALRVRLQADEAGALRAVLLGSRDLGAGTEAFRRLTAELRRIQTAAAAATPDDWEIEIEADYDLQYEHLVHAISACTAEIDPVTRQTRPLFQKIKFAPPHVPQGA
ncbi:biopolymer transporter ExbD [bacterium]|nr:biopolymer transporter ExbD [bacterium]